MYIYIYIYIYIYWKNVYEMCVRLKYSKKKRNIQDTLEG